jgi:hypothetical protein|tara:strand:+ start:526 stop:747 length:222 start_codon:yes stop_codon:yes gene_type:complete
MLLMNIFKDNNDWNEKTIIGAIAFFVMCVVMAFDLSTGYWGLELTINEFVYDSFVWVTLGCFGIAGVEKFAKK